MFLQTNNDFNTYIIYLSLSVAFIFCVRCWVPQVTFEFRCILNKACIYYWQNSYLIILQVVHRAKTHKLGNIFPVSQYCVIFDVHTYKSKMYIVFYGKIGCCSHNHLYIHRVFLCNVTIALCNVRAPSWFCLHMQLHRKIESSKVLLTFKAVLC